MSRRLPRSLRCLLFAGLSLNAGCEASLDTANGAFDDSPIVDTPAAPIRETAGSDGAGSAAGTPPEVEREASFQAPVVTGRYVWTANPDSGRVAVIDAQTFEVRSVQAGFRPTYIAALEAASGPARALVINTGANDASLLELSADLISVRHVGLHQGADSWSVSPDSRFAIAWTDSRKAASPDPTDGFQDITVLEMSGGQLAATRLTVGYRPSALAFDAQSRRAFAVTEDGISIVDLSPGAVRLQQLVALPSARRVQPDVSISADGARALARIDGSSILYDIDLNNGQTREIQLGGNITDLDLSADGRRAVAVIRSRTLTSAGADAGVSTLADAGDAGGGDAGAPVPEGVQVSEAVFIAVPEGLTDAAQRRSLTLPGASFGSVALSPDGSRAVLFSTALTSGRVTLVGPDLEYRSVNLIAPVRAVFVTADSAHALALQDPVPGSLKKGAFSVLSLVDVRAPKLVAADAPATFVALSPTNSERAIVTVSDPSTGLYGDFFVRMPSLQVDFSPLASRPLASGTVPAADKGFIAEEHPEGRITFINLADGAGREITGFELSAKVVNE
jgi:hypothetical protein